MYIEDKVKAYTFLIGVLINIWLGIYLKGKVELGDTVIIYLPITLVVQAFLFVYYAYLTLEGEVESTKQRERRDDLRKKTSNTLFIIGLITTPSEMVVRGYYGGE